MIAVLVVIGVLMMLIVAGGAYEFLQLQQQVVDAQGAVKTAQQQADVQRLKDQTADDPIEAVADYFREESHLSRGDQDISAAAKTAANTTRPEGMGQFSGLRLAAGAGDDRGMSLTATNDGLRFFDNAPTSLDAPITILDGLLVPEIRDRVALTLSQLLPGDNIDLFGITNMRELGPIYDGPYLVGNAVQFGQSSDIVNAAIGGQLFTRGSYNWVWVGPVGATMATSERARSAGVDVARWDLMMLMDDGDSRKSPLSTCPFPSNVCPQLWSWAQDGGLGSLTFLNGDTYVFDGRFITGPA